MLTFGEKLNESELVEMLEEADTKKDGKIDYDEFVKMLLGI